MNVNAIRREYSLTSKKINDKQMIKLLNDHNINSHISQLPLPPIRNTQQELITGFNGSGRPDGLWYSIGGNWLKFLVKRKKTINPLFAPCCYIYEIKINDKNILQLNEKNFKKFDKKYSNYWRSPQVIGRGYSYVKNSAKYNFPLKRLSGKQGKNYVKTLEAQELIYKSGAKFNKKFKALNGYTFTKQKLESWKFKRWDIVAKDYSGVEFNPYDHKSFLRDNYFWYWTIDIPSGCIWKAKDILEVNLIAVKPGKEKKWEMTPYGEDLL